MPTATLYHQRVMAFPSQTRFNDNRMATPLISVVDDDHSVRESLARLIRSVGFGVQVFGSAEEFLSADRDRQPDCLILDIRMPGMSGLELQRELSRSNRELPVVFITAHGSDDEVRRRALGAGAVDYLLKPLKEEEVLEAIEAALNSK
jgi:FixJ family two-component response regulator